VPADFDRWGRLYGEEVQRSIAFIGRSLRFFTEAKARHLRRIARTHLGSLEKQRVLDVGCGVGLTDRLLAGSFGALHGVDVASGAVEEAARLVPGVDFRHYEGGRLPFADAEMDLAFAICVLHHVPREGRVSLLREMRRVVRNGGLVVLFEHNPLNPLTRLAVRRCEFDANAVLLGRREMARLLALAALEPVESRYVLFFPFGGRVVKGLERTLARLPIGAQYYCAGRRAGSR